MKSAITKGNGFINENSFVNSSFNLKNWMIIYKNDNTFINN